MSDSLLFKPRRRAISLTALIDVVFILLMFFMLTSSFQRWGELTLQPLVSSPAEQPQPPLLVTLDPRGVLVLDGRGLRLEDFRQLDARHQRWFDEHQPVIVLPDASVPVQDLIDVMDRLRALGVSSVNYGGVVRLAAPLDGARVML